MQNAYRRLLEPEVDEGVSLNLKTNTFVSMKKVKMVWVEQHKHQHRSYDEDSLD